MRIHREEKPYICTMCNKSVILPGHLIRRMRIHTGEKPYRCFECIKSFTLSYNLKKNLTIYTRGKLYPEEPPSLLENNK